MVLSMSIAIGLPTNLRRCSSLRARLNFLELRWNQFLGLEILKVVQAQCARA